MKAIALFVSVTSAAALCASALAGPYTDAGISSNDPRFVAWATDVRVARGPQNISVSGGPLATFGAGGDAVGSPAVSPGTVSLGDGGSALVSFTGPLRNGPGADFATFENGFIAGNGVFAELAFVEVSSDGTNFFRFPSVSLTQTSTPVGSFGVMDPTDLKNLAGKHGTDGTGFDLAELANVSPLLNVNSVTHVRLIDVVGSLNPLYATHDSLGNVINDPFPTAFATGGFDLDAIGAINVVVPEPAIAALVIACAVLSGRRRV